MLDVLDEPKIIANKTITLQGLPPFEFFLHDSAHDTVVSQYLYTHGIWEPFETHLLRSLLRPGDCFVNAGANIGWYTVIASHCVGKEGSIIAFEPEANNFALLQKNVATNALLNVILEQKALGEVTGQTTLYLSGNNFGDHRVYSRAWSDDFDKTIATSIVEKVPLSQYAAQYPRIDCLMMDTQGAELDILRGTTQSLTETVILMEFWPNGLKGHEAGALEALLSYLEALPHQCYEIADSLIPLPKTSLRKRAAQLRHHWSAHTNLLLMPEARHLPSILQRDLVVRTLDNDGNWLIPPEVTRESTIKLPPINTDALSRIKMTTRCRDADHLPRHPLAGQKVEHKGILAQIMWNGLPVVAGGYYGDWMAQLIETLQGVHEPQEEKVFYELIKRLPANPVMMEWGAFWAYYSLWVKHERRDARCICVEPDANNAEVGKKNFALNDYDAQFLIGTAGASYEQEILFRRETDGTEVKIPQFSVDYLMDTLNLPFLDVLHVDAQGAELATLFGAEHAFRRGKIRFVVLSTHHTVISGDPIIHQRCLAFLQQIGAHIIAEHNVSESFSGDGLIVASCDERDRDFTVCVSKNVDSANLFREMSWDVYEASKDAEPTNKIYREKADVHVAFVSALNKLEVSGNKQQATALGQIFNAPRAAYGKPILSFLPRAKIKKVIKKGIKKSLHLIVRPVYRRIKPILKPIAARIRRYFTAEMTKELQKITSTIQALQNVTRVVQTLRDDHALLRETMQKVLTQTDEMQIKFTQIEQYGATAVRRVALPCGENEMLLRTEVGYLLCANDDYALLACLTDTGELEPGTRQLIQRIVRPNDTVIDVGAHLGMHTLAAARALQGKGKVIAFEPFATTAHLLEKTVLLNGFSSITEIHQAAVSNVRGVRRLFLGKISGHHSLFPLYSPQDESNPSISHVEVPVVVLDEILPVNAKVDLVKIDVEGAELEVIEGGKKMIANNPNIALIVEFWPPHLERSKRSIKAWFDAFAAMDFCYKVINEQTSALEDYTIEQLTHMPSVNLLFARQQSTVWQKAAL